MQDDTRKVTERDFCLPEFRNADPDEYEFRHDGAIVRKDRWENAVHSIRNLLRIDGREFEIGDVVEAVRTMSGRDGNWSSYDPSDDEDMTDGERYVLRLDDGSILRNAVWTRSDERTGWNWRGGVVRGVEAFRDEDPKPDPAVAILGRDPEILWKQEIVRNGTRTRLTLSAKDGRILLVRVTGDPAWSDAEAFLEFSRTANRLSDPDVMRPNLDDEGAAAWECFVSSWQPIEGAGFSRIAAFDFGERWFAAVPSASPKTILIVGCVREGSGSWTTAIRARIDVGDLGTRRS